MTPPDGATQCGAFTCPLVNFNPVNGYGDCMGSTGDTCDQYAPFACALGKAYTDPMGLGVCDSANFKCSVWYGYSKGCVPPAS